MDQPPRRGIHALASMLPKVTAPIFKKRGFAEAGILTDWPAIVGAHLARHTMPEKIAFARGARTAGTLHVVTESAFAPELQHLEPQVIERINGYFGYYAVGRLRIQHGRVVHPPAARAPQTPYIESGEPDPAVRAVTAEIAEEPLSAALDRLGQAVRSRQSLREERDRSPGQGPAGRTPGTAKPSRDGR